ARPLRQGPHLLGADPDHVCARGAGVVEGSAAVAVRAGGLPAVMVPLPAAARRQLRPSGADRHRAGGSPPSPPAESLRAAGPLGRTATEPESAGAYPAEQRRLPRSDAADELRDDEPGEHRAGGSSGGP